MIRVRIVRNFRGPTDRLRNGRVRLYQEGDIHVLADEVAEYLLAQGLVEDADTRTATERKIVDAGEHAENVDEPPRPTTVDDLERNGAWYTLPNGDKAMGRENAERALAEMQT